MRGLLSHLMVFRLVFGLFWRARFPDARVQKLLHPLHHPEPPRRQSQAVPADGGVLPRCVHRTPYGAAVSLGHAVREFRNPKRIPRRAMAPQHVAVLNCVASAPSRKPKTQTGAPAASAKTYPRLPGICAMTREISAARVCLADSLWRIADPHSCHLPPPG